MTSPFVPVVRVRCGVCVVIADDPPWVRVWLPARAVARAAAIERVVIRIEGYDHT